VKPAARLLDLFRRRSDPAHETARATLVDG